MRKTPWKHVDEDAVKAKLALFTGEISQTPPMYAVSAAVHQGEADELDQIFGLENGRQATVRVRAQGPGAP